MPAQLGRDLILWSVKGASMGIQTVSDKLFDYLISNISGEQFESLAKRLFSAIDGDEYVPLGGMHDGGAD